MSRELTMFTDGACKGNPGPAGLGVVFYENDQEVASFSEPIGEATNNIAEYKALLLGLEKAQALGVDFLKIRTDSELMFKQISGVYKVKHENMKPLYEQAMTFLKQFRGVEMKAVPRAENARADELATQAIRSLKTKANTDSCPDVFHIGEESPSSKG